MTAADSTSATGTPVFLGANQPTNRFYSGGAKIAGFRAIGESLPATPEDWIASTTALFNEHEKGLTVLPSGRLLRDEIREHAVTWLGEQHLRSYGADTMLLVKLLDAGQRLPVHVHPNREFAQENLNVRHGKAEAWYILEGGDIHLGFCRDVRPSELQRWVETQNVSSMLASMHRLTVSAGDFVFVPPGIPHAIGQEVFLIEVQEPEDLSILLEWTGYDLDGPRDGHLGLGFDAALRAVDGSGWSGSAIRHLVVRAGSRDRLPTTADRFFRADRLEIGVPQNLEPGFSVLICVEGAGRITTANGFSSQFAKGDTLAIPHDCGTATLSGDAIVLRCRPPAPL
ncbi:class I mannose-6-phosphate isomerase [Paramicrobacterium agarici]|uniref:Mannose-6-phosphate isomerase n=1 Tax=Paramicrobacterium agarici TaxID=630514 RepID=A0A2A9DU19_9MICO|nr:class I mannose-6-phosphate isomerase [Microbacterium agarici]PFG29871.1 mannose-6-phosphate isomerase [Microbacterium agarici]